MIGLIVTDNNKYQFCGFDTYEEAKEKLSKWKEGNWPAKCGIVYHCCDDGYYDIIDSFGDTRAEPFYPNGAKKLRETQS